MAKKKVEDKKAVANKEKMNKEIAEEEAKEAAKVKAKA